YRYLLLMTKNSTLAEDLTGETFERALRSWRRFDPRRAGARTWLCQIARSTALDHFRAEDRRRRREERFARETPAVEERPFAERVRGYVGKVAANEPAPRRRLLPRLTLRQTGFALAGAAASLVAVSLIYGLISSGGPGGKTAASTRSSAGRERAALPAHTAVA